MLSELKKTDWWAPLSPILGAEYWAKVAVFLDTAYQADTVYPTQENVFRALLTTPLADTKVVILGQDPYPNANQAMGLSFSVPASQPLPKSLVNIYRELEDDLGLLAPSHGDLTSWAQQGVLLLNTVLTVPAQQRNGHAKLIWEALTDAIIKLVADQPQPVVFILWGKPAQQKIPLISTTSNLIIATPHPSPLSAYRGFFGSRPFSQTNAYLQAHNVAPINWVE
ncbi:MAG: uracil-DNA glycosylase [Lactobacillaceae bacterium]|jgi:uracil-DNA glycosylase|nr:uracil-DNA glycosylase [Lactobacillaceae bacterium]